MHRAKKFIRFQNFIFVLWIFLVIVVSYTLILHNKKDSEDEPVQVATPITTPVLSPTPLKPSYATPLLLFPQNNATIVDSNPSFLLKMPQARNEIFLQTKLGEDTYWSPYGYYTERYQGLEFLPGEAQNIGITIDGIPIPDVHGFAQYPYIICTSEIGSEEFEKLITQEECLAINYVSIPPAIILFKSTKPLLEGAHRILVTEFGRVSEFTITVDPGLSIPQQVLPRQFRADYFSRNTSSVPVRFAKSAYAGHDNADRNDIYSLLQEYQLPDYDWLTIKSDDACPADYWYKGDLLALPHPATINPLVYYTLHLPASGEEFGAKEETSVSMMFDSYLYDLNITDYDSFYPSYEYSESYDRVDGSKSLFLPINHLVYTHSREPLLTRAREVAPDPETKPSVLFSYLEFTPYDYSGREYKENMLLHTVIHSSGCDG